MARRRDSGVRITTAATSAADDIAGRQRRYLISMAIRTACVIGAVVVGDNALRWILIVGAVFLPYIAVVLANPETRKRDELDLLDTEYRREIPGRKPL